MGCEEPEGEGWAVTPARLALQGWGTGCGTDCTIHSAGGWGNTAEQYKWGWDT